jgi:hypothetical protein
LQNRYVGDVGDYAKYGLLRLMTAELNTSCGVVWCLFDDESHNADGRHIGYLKDQLFNALDPELHNKLAKIVAGGRRSVKAVALSGILPKATRFFERPISTPLTVRANRLNRQNHRSAWLAKALRATAGCELVFFDPDNGLETKSVPAHSPKSGKYIYWDELLPFWERGQSLLIYHHLNRTASVHRQAEILKEKFAAKFPDAGAIRFFLFRRGSCRHFWLVTRNNHFDQFQRTMHRFSQSPWHEYFEVGC